MSQVVDTGLTQEQEISPIDWKKCVLCHLDSIETLVIPQNRKGITDGYETLAVNLEKFNNIDALPFSLDISKLDDGSGLKNTMINNSARWHKLCYMKCNNTKLKRAEAKYNREMVANPRIPSPVKTRSVCTTEYVPQTCLFCELPATRSNPLHKVQTKKCNDYILDNVTALKDAKIISKVLERCDLMALEAEYHKNCYTKLRNKVQQQDNIHTQQSHKCQIKALAFAELVSYINECKDGEGDDACSTFGMAQIVKLYTDCLRGLGLECEVHSTRLKERLLEECPSLQACEKPGKQTILIFRREVDCTVRSLHEARNYDVESRALCDAAKVVRTDIFRCRDDCEATESDKALSGSKIPTSLIALIKMIVNGTCIENNTEDEERDQVVNSIAQLLAFHARKTRKNASRRHKKKSETPTPVYLAMKLYGETRKRKLIDLTYQMGLSISYFRLNNILTQKSNEICSFYNTEGVVCPPSCVRGVFTTAAVDNLDHNTSSTTAISSFHGTAISIMQHHYPGQEGEKRIIPPLNEDDIKKTNVMTLPLDYAAVQPCFVEVKSAQCTLSEMCTINIDQDSPFLEELPWLHQTTTDECISWNTYHAAVQHTRDPHKTTTALMPLFTEQAHSSAMMIHTMNVVHKATKHLNPEQTPVLVADQPLYALLKQIQFRFPETYGEDKFFVLMGGLHIEMAALRLAGQWLNNSGWINVLVLAEITTQGRAESLINANHVTRARYAHQVTVAALYALQYKAYNEYKVSAENEGPLTFEAWRGRKCKEIPQFKYWDLAMNVEVLVLQFVRSIRTADFSLYIKSLRRLLPWFFSLDFTNYARWVSVHLRDLANLRETHPELAKEFYNGLFTARKTNRCFSAIALDQAHEQLNALIKGDGGMVGLTENPDSFRKWMIAGPELACTVQQFEHEVLHLPDDEDTTHHSQKPSTQQNFLRHVRKLEEILTDMGNPFLEDSSDLYNLDTKNVAPAEVVKSVMNIEKLGEDQYLTFCEERLHNGTALLTQPIKKNMLPLFGKIVQNSKHKSKSKLLGLKNDCSLFSKLYIATSEHRSGDLDTFFKHENQPSPPSISLCGEIRSCAKSDLVKCLTQSFLDSAKQDIPPVQVKILDGAAIVHMLSPGQSKTFKDYAERVFVTFGKKELASVRRLDFVWDRYLSDSLKNSTREKRGSGIRTRVSLSTKIPKSWPSFLRESVNKDELFKLLATYVSSITEDGKEVCSTIDSSVINTSGRDTSGSLSPCNHEEADTRIMIHVADAVAQGYNKIMIRSVDTDVVAMAICCVQKVEGLAELWLHLGVGTNHKYLAAHHIAASLGPHMSQALPMFHAFTGCDTVSSFCGKGKKSAYDAWRSYPEATTGFVAAVEGNVEEAMGYLEKYVVTLYDRSCTVSSVNECRKILFTKMDRTLENIPPTLDALKQHALRAMYQGGKVWGQAHVLHQELPSPSNWGWKKTEDGWKPEWTTIPTTSKACLELVRCKCKKGCGGRCNCIKRKLKCTNLCLCDGKCGN